MRTAAKRLPALALLWWIATALSAATTPSLDKSRLEAYIRYAEGYTAEVKIKIDDPAPSEFAGLSRVPVHLTLGTQSLERVYYAGLDGNPIIGGTVWSLNASPFADILARLPLDGPAFGPPNARVTLVVFSDFECPYCRELAFTLRQKLASQHSSDVRVVFADFPIEAIHKWALPAAVAGRCVRQAGGDGAFWTYHDWIFEHQGEITADNLKDKLAEYAKAHTLDISKMAACQAEPAITEAVRRQSALGSELGVQQTPTFFINGRIVAGALPWDPPSGPSLNAVLQLELHRPPVVPGPMPPKS